MDEGEKITYNFTIRIPAENLTTLENWLASGSGGIELIDSRIVPDTSELYENDSHFKSLVKKVKEAKEARDAYINKKNI